MTQIPFYNRHILITRRTCIQSTDPQIQLVQHLLNHAPSFYHRLIYSDSKTCIKKANLRNNDSNSDLEWGLS